MNKLKKINYKFIIFNFIFLFIICYFVFHCFVGERGYIKMLDLKEKVISRKSKLIALNEERSDLESKVSLVYDENINRDHLDELARKYFGLINEDEICISGSGEVK
jgi:cell division protein FtsB